jgi:hypothetical protein
MSAFIDRTANWSKAQALDQLCPTQLSWLPRQVVEHDPTQATLICGQRGLIIHIPAGAFRDQAGQVLTSKMEIELIEVDSKAAILLAGQATVSRDQAFETGGMFHLAAYAQGQALKLNRPLHIEWPLYLPLSKNTPLRLLSDGAARTRVVQQDQQSDWLPLNITPLQIQWKKNQARMSFDLHELGWVASQNTQTFNGLKGMFTATIAGEAACMPHKTAFVVLDDCQSVVRLFCQNQKFSTFNMPMRKAGTIVVLAENGEQLYIGVQNFAARNTGVLTISPKPMERSLAPHWLFHLLSK